MVRSKLAKPMSTPLKMKEKVRKELDNLEKKSENTTAKMSMPMVKHRFLPGERALKEIRHYQKTTKLIIPRKSFERVVREITLSVVPSEYLPVRFRPLAIEALQEAAETYLVQFFEDCLLCCVHGKRVTLRDVDMQLARRIRGRSDIINH